MAFVCTVRINGSWLGTSTLLVCGVVSFSTGGTELKEIRCIIDHIFGAK